MVTTRNLVEFNAFYHALKGPVAVGVALGMLPEKHTTHRVPAHQQLVPIVDHLRSLGIENDMIDDMIEKLFKDEETLCSLSKIVALAAVYQDKDNDQETYPLSRVVALAQKKHVGNFKIMLQSHLKHILKLHFATDATRPPATNMKWLFEHGLMDCYGDDYRRVDQMLIEHIAQGKLAAVHQFLLMFDFGWAAEIDCYFNRRGDGSASKIKRLFLPAFNLAMEHKAYGKAAALAQICDEISEEDRDRALELAIVHNQRISLQWAYRLG